MKASDLRSLPIAILSHESQSRTRPKSKVRPYGRTIRVRWGVYCAAVSSSIASIVELLTGMRCIRSDQDLVDRRHGPWCHVAPGTKNRAAEAIEISSDGVC